jgi:hypothetical protein
LLKRWGEHVKEARCRSDDLIVGTHRFRRCTEKKDVKVQTMYRKKDT